MKIVYRAGNVTEAEIVKGMLISHGIEAHVSGYYLQGGVGELAPVDLAKVHVEDDEFEVARKLVMEYEGKEVDQSAADRASDIDGDKQSHQFMITTIIVFLIVILSYWIGF